MSLILRDIRHNYASGLAVDGATLEAASGEIIALFGPSGCGKTTLLRIAAGLERLQSGSVALDGAVLASASAHTPPERRSIGFMFQDLVLFPHMTVEQNIAFGLSHLPAAERAQRVQSEIAAVALGAEARRFPHELSGGQQQRAALARAFARQPRAMLLDEPFASIDSALRRRLRSEMRGILKGRGAPAIFVTHDAEEAIEIGDRIAIMKAGKILETASARELFSAAQSLEGAAMFPGSQVLACASAPGGLATAFGMIETAAEGPAATRAVIQPGGAAVRPAPNGQAIVIDCRFAGPEWSVLVGSEADPEATLRATAPAPLAAGARAAIDFDPRRVRAFAGI